MGRDKLLVVNNYSMKKSLEMIAVQELPRHHAWGIDMLAEKFNLRFLNYRCPKWMIKYHFARFYYYWFQFETLIKSIGCRGVYAAASPLVDLLAFLKDKGLFSKRLIMVVHHPGNFSLKNKNYDKLLFITRTAFDKACFDYPVHKDMFLYNEWGPDMEFYQQLYDKSLHRSEKVPTFISIGISFRDHDTLVEAALKSSCKVAIICTERSAPKRCGYPLPSNIDVMVQKNNPLVGGNLLSYSEMTVRLLSYDVVVIPVPKGHTGLCGLTSFNDAIALGKPVIVSDTTHLGINIEEEGFGFVYKAGDSDSLKEKMMEFVKNPSLIGSMGATALAYARKNNNRHFSETILKQMES